jgi:hypothetical protein
MRSTLTPDVFGDYIPEADGGAAKKPARATALAKLIFSGAGEVINQVLASSLRML